jgi:hypothetical protein
VQKPALPTKPLAQVGSVLSLEGVTFAKAPVSLLLVVSPTCKYCLASEHFHSKLLEIARAANTPVYVAVPARDGSSHYMHELGASDDAVKEYRQLSLSIPGTPTVLGIDNAGRVRAEWSGLATPADEIEIVNLVRTRSFSEGKESTKIDAPNIEPQELNNFEQKTPSDVIDIRERDKVSSTSSSINIPAEELPFRASHELDKAQLQIIDCTNIVWSACNAAVRTLKELRFDTATLGAGTYHARCKLTPSFGL